MKKLLFIYNNPLDGSYGGSQRTKQAFGGLKLYYEIIPYSCVKNKSPIRTFARNLCLYAGLLSKSDCRHILALIRTNDFAGIYFDVSLHGRLVKKIKKAYPKLKIIVNYHNDEKQFYWDGVKQNGLHWFPVFLSAAYNENLSKRYADLNVFITEEDRQSISPVKKSIIIPPTLLDYFPVNTPKQMRKEPFILFLGAATSPNKEAACFLIEQIAPRIALHCVIAGKGMDAVFGEYNSDKMNVYGYVEDMTSLFFDAVAFVSPIYHGSGAKIKIAEALMFGKRIIATPCSLFGYDLNGAVYDVCETAEDFCAAIQSMNSSVRFFQSNRKCFVENYASSNLPRYYGEIEKFLSESGKGSCL